MTSFSMLFFFTKCQFSTVSVRVLVNIKQEFSRGGLEEKKWLIFALFYHSR
ncbi:uncharacterized protein METZ01_LOCUS241655, partial [marine metagenome]